MNYIKIIWKNTGARVAIIVTVIVVALIIAINCVCNFVLPVLMDTMFGGERSEKVGTTGDNQYFKTDEGITDKASALAAANKVNEEICEEGFILLKNGATEAISDDILPMQTSATSKKKVSIFGKNSANIAYGSSGSVGAAADDAVTLFDSLTSANFEINPTLKAFYEDTAASGTVRPSAPSMASGAIPEGFATGETPVSSYTDAVKSSFAQYNDLALVVITRTSGENSDLPTTMKNTAGAYAETDHYLELDRNEQEMLKLACENFENVVLLINAGTPIELGFLDATDDNDESALSYDFASEVKGAIQIGLPGEVGMSALGKILNGEVNPSGRTVDTYVRDFTKIPALENYSIKGENNLDSYTLNGTAQDQWFIDYEEGIYVGYKYFETRGETDGEEWYDNNVVYPLGYGLSYTTFTKEVNQYYRQCFLDNG